MGRDSIVPNLISGSRMSGIIDAINKVEQIIKDTASYLFADNETPAGAIDDSNTVYTLADSPYPSLSLKLYLNGVYQTAGGEDYTLSGTTITFINAPWTGSILRAFYRYR